eukprot:5931416-Prymnesium_polylepis.1
MYSSRRSSGVRRDEAALGRGTLVGGAPASELAGGSCPTSSIGARVVAASAAASAASVVASKRPLALHF